MCPASVNICGVTHYPKPSLIPNCAEHSLTVHLALGAPASEGPRLRLCLDFGLNFSYPTTNTLVLDTLA